MAPVRLVMVSKSSRKLERLLARITKPISYQHLIERRLLELTSLRKEDKAIIDMVLILGGEYPLVDMVLTKDSILPFLHS